VLPAGTDLTTRNRGDVPVEGYFITTVGCVIKMADGSTLDDLPWS
jgi:hypothetical protein